MVATITSATFGLGSDVQWHLITYPLSARAIWLALSICPGLRIQSILILWWLAPVWLALLASVDGRNGLAGGEAPLCGAHDSIWATYANWLRCALNCVHPFKGCMLGVVSLAHGTATSWLPCVGTLSKIGHHSSECSRSLDRLVSESVYDGRCFLHTNATTS